MPRGERLLWLVPAIVAVQQLVVALPGDGVSADPTAALFLVLFVLALTWAAAARHSFAAWGVLVAYAVAMVLLPAWIGGGYDVATSVYLMLGLLVVGVLFWPAARAHVGSDE